MADPANVLHAGKAPASCEAAARITKSLLGYGMLAGPFYVVVVLIQASMRQGFDLAHDDVSLLSNGGLGWLQIANFVITGVMVIAFAAGVHRALPAGVAATWGPRLIGLFGLGLIGAGVFSADPMNGFPPGTPAGHATVLSLHGMLHVACAGIGFLGLIAACFVASRRLSSEGQQRLATFSRATGVIFLAAFLGIASGSSSIVVVGGFWFALLVAWAWMGWLAADLYRRVAASVPAATVTNVTGVAGIRA